jgi:hypothetical protein
MYVSMLYYVCPQENYDLHNANIYGTLKCSTPLCSEPLYQILPKSDNKHGEYRHKLNHNGT